ncbi:hypothetical protein DRQ20_01465 [bacterium]|nr:MAG: hypothetical protein DRQ20_01465 [bacterium]
MRKALMAGLVASFLVIIISGCYTPTPDVSVWTENLGQAVSPTDSMITLNYIYITCLNHVDITVRQLTFDFYKTYQDGSEELIPEARWLYNHEIHFPGVDTHYIANQPVEIDGVAQILYSDSQILNIRMEITVSGEDAYGDGKRFSATCSYILVRE